jgi:hypothetical protein
MPSPDHLKGAPKIEFEKSRRREFWTGDCAYFDTCWQPTLHPNERSILKASHSRNLSWMQLFDETKE